MCEERVFVCVLISVLCMLLDREAVKLSCEEELMEAKRLCVRCVWVANYFMS